MKHIILCADDYGQNDAISQAIIDLFNKNRLSATSCMTNSMCWPSHAKELIPFVNQVDIGLHFNLTEGKPLSPTWGSSFSTVSNLIVKAYLKRLNSSCIEDELNRQLDLFCDEMGMLPQFVDGHQHIHQLPTVRDAFLRVYEKRLRKEGAYIRSVYAPRWFWQFNNGYLKRCIIQACGSYSFKKFLKERDILHNSSFSGSYDFNSASHYSNLFPNFLNEVKTHGLIMCHPGLISKANDDPIGRSRWVEYEYLVSDQFLRDCHAAQVKLTRYNKKSEIVTNKGINR